MRIPILIKFSSEAPDAKLVGGAIARIVLPYRIRDRIEPAFAAAEKLHHPGASTPLPPHVPVHADRKQP